MTRRRSIFVPLGEVPGDPMSAPALRRYEIGRALSDDFDVAFGLADPSRAHGALGGARIVENRNRKQFVRNLKSCDFLYTLGVQPRQYNAVARSGVKLILDYYTPRPFETLEATPNGKVTAVRSEHKRDVSWAISQLRLADFLVCTNEFQRDFWVGFLAGCGMLDVEHCRRSPDLSRYIGVVPHGISQDQIENSLVSRGKGTPLRDMLGLSRSDVVVLWSSKVLAWQDPVLLMRSFSEVVKKDRRFKLVLLGVGDLPSDDTVNLDGDSFRAKQAFDAARDLGLVGKSVFFVEKRIPFNKLGGFYQDCDFAVGTYPASLETHFCLATRFMDYVAAGIPFVVSGTASQDQLVQLSRGGILVSPGDVGKLTTAILRMGSPYLRRRYAENLANSREKFLWSNVVTPIADYCTNAELSREINVSRLRGFLQLLEFAARQFHFKTRFRRGQIAE